MKKFLIFLCFNFCLSYLKSQVINVSSSVVNVNSKIKQNGYTQLMNVHYISSIGYIHNFKRNWFFNGMIGKTVLTANKFSALQSSNVYLQKKGLLGGVGGGRTFKLSQKTRYFFEIGTIYSNSYNNAQIYEINGREVLDENNGFSICIYSKFGIMVPLSKDIGFNLFLNTQDPIISKEILNKIAVKSSISNISFALNYYL